MNDHVLRIDGLSVAYRVKEGDFEALHNIGFDLAPGEVLGVVGESGCGKSTLSSAILQLLPPNGRITGGTVQLDGRDLLGLSTQELRALRGAQIGMIFQDPLTSLNPAFRVSTQMINAQRCHASKGHSDSKTLRERAVTMLDRVGIPDAKRRIDDYPHQFSGGMRQRIMIATVLLLEPQVLICDEATSALDVTLQAQVLELLRDLCRERGTALIVISHDIGVIGEMSDRVCVLYAGRIIESGDVADILNRPAHPYTRKLVASVPSRHRRDEPLSTIPGRVPSLAALPPGCAFAPRCEAAQSACEGAEPDLIEVDGRRLRCLPDIRDAGTATGSSSADEPARVQHAVEKAQRDRLLVEIAGLSTHFTERQGVVGRALRRTPHTVRAVDGVDLTLARGEIVGLVGESGSGKTTLGKTLLNLVEPTAGTVSYGEVRLEAQDRVGWRRVRSRMKMIFQETYGSLSPRLRVDQLITEPYRIAKTPTPDRRSVDELLELVGLSSEQASKYPHQLSGGQARRVGIARALALHPEFVVADEPTSGLDVSAAAGVLNLLQNLRERLDLTLLIITHDLNLVGYVADRIAVMQHGKIVEVGSANEIMDSPQHPYTQALLASIPDPWGDNHPGAGRGSLTSIGCDSPPRHQHHPAVVGDVVAGKK